MKTLSLSLVFTVFIAAKAAEGNSSNLTNLFSSEAAVFAQDFRYAGADKQTGKPCACGQENVQTRIINGKKVQKNRYPWMVYILTPKNSDPALCSGSLINDRYVLTTAHCIPSGTDPKKILAVLGVHDLQGKYVRLDDSMERLEVESYVMPKGRIDSFNRYQYDIALVKLKNPVKIGKGSKWNPICLPNFSQYSNLFITGYGKVNGGLTGRTILQSNGLNEAELFEVFDPRCTPYGSVWNQKKMCARSYTQGTCNGDSGAPLGTRHNGHVYIAGTLSLGPIDCGVDSSLNPKRSSVYDKVVTYLDWIQENTSDAKWCIAPDVPEFTKKNPHLDPPPSKPKKPNPPPNPYQVNPYQQYPRWNNQPWPGARFRR